MFLKKSPAKIRTSVESSVENSAEFSTAPSNRESMNHLLRGLSIVCCMVTIARADGADRTTCPESLAWLVNQVEWLVPSIGPSDALRSQRVVVLHLREHGNSAEVASAVMLWQARNPSPNVQILCVWRSISSVELTRRIATLPRSWSHARDFRDTPGLLWSVTDGPVYVAAYGESGNHVWHVEADSTIGSVLDRWLRQGSVPTDSSLPLRTTDEGRFALELRPTSSSRGSAISGVADRGRRCWVRRGSGDMILRAVIEFLQPDAEVTNVAIAGSTGMLYDLDLVVPATVDRAGICDSLVKDLSSRFGLIAVHEKVSYVRPILNVIDSALLSSQAEAGTSCLTIGEVLRMWYRRYNERVTVSCAGIDTAGINIPIRWERSDSTNRDLARAGLSVVSTWRTTQRWVIRPVGVPESEIVYLLGRTYAMPTIGALVHHADGRTWYGMEAGIISGRLNSGHGFFGLMGYRVCAEYQHADRGIGGFSLGVDTSTFLVLRLRHAMYTDFTDRLWLSLIPEIGLGYVGRFGLTVGGTIPIVGNPAVPASVRASVTYNHLPAGAR